MTMLKSPIAKIALAVVAGILALGVLRFKPWQALRGDATGEREHLTVGFLPVT